MLILRSRFAERSHSPKQRLTKWLGACAIVFLLVSGCARQELQSHQDQRPNPFHDEFAHWGENHRPAGQPGNLTGTSDEARQVERNLGVR